MLSLFPELLDWSFFVPSLFRLFLGVYLLSIGYNFLKRKDEKESDQDARHALGMLLCVFGLGFFFGIYVQVCGVVGFATSLVALYFKQHNSPLTPESKTFYLLVGLVSFSLIFLGAGAYAFDLPL
jgi:uncharacterized membrane protein YfcA